MHVDNISLERSKRYAARCSGYALLGRRLNG
jgi:hypothetical protein